MFYLDTTDGEKDRVGWNLADEPVFFDGSDKEKLNDLQIGCDFLYKNITLGENANDSDNDDPYCSKPQKEEPESE